MARPTSISQSDFPYHVSARCINKEWFCLPIDLVWEIFCRQLTYVHRAYNAKIHAFVLMNNHFHLLISTPDANLSKIMANLMRETSRHINESAGRINQTYGARHYRSVISSNHYFLHAYKYLYYNPVAAGLVQKCEDYKYSSLNFILGNSYAGFPTLPDDVLFPEIQRTLNWLNSPPKEEDWKNVSLAMRKSHLRIAPINSSRRKSHLELQLL